MFLVAYTTRLESPFNSIDLKNSFGYLMGRTMRLLKAHITKAFRDEGIDLTMEQYIIIRHLGNGDGINQQTLAEEMERNKTTITRALNGLEKRNFAVRIPDQIDRRVKLVYLTKQGRDIQQQLTSIVEAVFKQALKGIEDHDLEKLHQNLHLIHLNLDTDNHTPDIT